MTSKSQTGAHASLPTLASLRTQIDSVDEQLIQLLAQRQQLTRQVGAVKRAEHGPIFVPEREQALFAARKAKAQAAGVSPELVEDVLKRVIRESYLSQQSQFPQALEGYQRACVIGGQSGMGAKFVQLLRASGFQVAILEKEDWPNAQQLLADCQVLVIAVPISAVAAVCQQLATLALPDSLLLVDVTSVKAAPLSAMLACHRGPVLGLHPMFGPDVRHLVRQTVIVCEGRAPQAAERFLAQLKIWGCELVSMSAEQHDQAMQIIQCLRHFSAMAYGQFLAQQPLDIDTLLKASSPIYKLELSLVGRLFAQNPALYAEIMQAQPSWFHHLDAFISTLQQMREQLQSPDRTAFLTEFAKVQDYLGEHANRFLKHSADLLAKAND